MPKPKPETFSQKIIFRVITGIITVISSFIIYKLTSEPKGAKKAIVLRDSVITRDNLGKPKVTSNVIHRKDILYVEVELNVNSNDIVLVNGEPPTPDEISGKPNTLKLILGKLYKIKINNCPEREIIPLSNQENSVSVCM